MEVQIHSTKTMRHRLLCGAWQDWIHARACIARRMQKAMENRRRAGGEESKGRLKVGKVDDRIKKYLIRLF